MINTLKISAAQVQLCKDIIGYFAAKSEGKDVTEDQKTRWGKGLFRRVELREAHEKLRDHVACPYFITKNTAAKASKKEGAGLYNVQRFIDHAAKHPPAEKNVDAEGAESKPKAKGKKNAAPKKEAAKSKKGGKKAPAETPTSEEVPAMTAETPATDQPTE